VAPDAAPSSWLLFNADLIPREGRALDVACGAGRHSLYLAKRGLAVRAVDRDAAAIETLRAEAARQGVGVAADVVDLEAGEVRLGNEAYDLIVVVHYLHRPLFPQLVQALAPGGVLIYETFSVDQALQGKPTTPAFLLHHGELRGYLTTLTLIRELDGTLEGGQVSAISVRKPGP
jgi:SAM-dependent methyltransferase